MQDARDVQRFKKAVRIYHGFPSLAAVLVLGLYLLVFFLTSSNWLSVMVAAIPAVLLMWRWSVAGKLIDSGCPHCGQNLKGKLLWSYPPKICPHCGASLR